MTTMSRAPLRTRYSHISRPCSAVSGWGHEQLADPGAASGRVGGVERVLGVDIGGGASLPLRLGHDVVGERRLARRLRPEHLGDSSLRDSAHSEGHIEGYRSGGYRLDAPPDAPFAEPHHGPAAEVPVDLSKGQLQRPLLLSSHGFFLLLCPSAIGAVPSGAFIVASVRRVVEDRSRPPSQSSPRTGEEATVPSSPNAHPYYIYVYQSVPKCNFPCAALR